MLMEIESQIDSRIEKIQKLEFGHDFNYPDELFDEYVQVNSLFGINLDQSIYRVLKFKYFKESLTKGILSLRKTSSWDDKMEGALFQCPGLLGSGEYCSLSALDKSYGMCWSTKAESELLWNAYSFGEKETVKIKSTPRKIMKYFYNYKNDITHYNSYYCGRINYISREDYRNFLENYNLGKYSFGGRLYDFFIYHSFLKLMGHEDENEVRFLFYNHNTEKGTVKDKLNCSDKAFDFPIDFNDAIDEVIFHPSMKEEDVIENTNLLQHLNYNNSIKQSDLYKPLGITLDFSNPFSNSKRN